MSLCEVAMNSPQSQKLADGSMVSMYTSEPAQAMTHPSKLVIRILRGFMGRGYQFTTDLLKTSSQSSDTISPIKEFSTEAKFS